MSAARGWYRDPSGRRRSRLWDGQQWSGWVDGIDGGQDPLPLGDTFDPPGEGSHPLYEAQIQALPFAAPAAAPSVNRFAIASLALVLLGVLLSFLQVAWSFWIASIGAVFCSVVGWRQISASHGAQTGKKLIVAAWVIVLLMVVLVIVAVIVLLNSWPIPE